MTKEERPAYRKQYYEDNKEKERAYKKQYYEDNKEGIANKQKSLRDARNLEIFKYKGGECAHCKLREPDHLEVYDYHHIDPSTKSYTVSNMLYGPMDKIIAEVDKCLLLCSNCHRKEHARLNKEKQDEII